MTEEYRKWLRKLFTGLAKSAGALDPKRLGRQLALLYDGAAAARLDKDRSGAGAAARSAAEALLDVATGGAPSGGGRETPTTAGSQLKGPGA